MANKQYISPIRLLNHLDISLQGDINVGRIKKQLAAEFDFNTSGIIEVAGFAYNKSDVFEELENLDFLERLSYHKRIWENKHLLATLETNVVNLQEVFAELKNFSNDEVFDNFISPYFAISFNNVARGYLNPARLQVLGDWYRCESYVLIQDKEEAYKATRIFLNENIRLLKNVNAQNFKTFRPQIAHWFTRGGANFFNNLPDNFHDEKHQIVFHMINICVAIQRNFKYDCKVLSKELTSMQNLPSDYQKIIDGNHRIYMGESASRSNDGEKSYGWIIWVVIVVIRIIMMMAK